MLGRQKEKPCLAGFSSNKASLLGKDLNLDKILLLVKMNVEDSKSIDFTVMSVQVRPRAPFLLAKPPFFVESSARQHPQ